MFDDSEGSGLNTLIILCDALVDNDSCVAGVGAIFFFKI